MMPLLRLLTGIAALQLLIGCYVHSHVPYWHNDPTQIPGCVPIGNNVSMYFGEVTLDDYGEFIIANQFDRSLYPADSALGDQSYKDIFKQLDGVKDMQGLARKFLGNRTDTGFYYPARYAMGGSFRQYASECTSDHEQSYSGPQDWVGFRYVVTIR